ncbi:tRNA pseudouridine(38-40) synthase TruA [Hominifimenecus sp. rT4P-3]|uniref:tRNA pseudouridine(38-40) synthase TruA n=1 Tax=Hominifimenecus sp. rT4P-3 TaxID=3242979 RepID=UPI003DA3A86E
MRRIMLTVAYDGTNYCGWQLQPNGITVEAVLNRELSKLLKEEIRVQGASRTDSGVHALGNLCVFDTNTRIPAEKICYAVNQSLPADIVVQKSEEVPDGYHPRKCESVKTYEYTIYNRKLPNPVFRLYSYFFYTPLDVTAMQEGAAFLVGEHDFKSFCSAGSQVESTVRTILDLTVREDGPLIKIRVCGTGFLYNMVRIIAGTLIRVGSGYWKPEMVGEILEKKDRTVAGPKAPAEGLCLMEIKLKNPPNP